MTEVKIFAFYSQVWGEFTANFKVAYSQAYSPMCESSINMINFSFIGDISSDKYIFLKLLPNCVNETTSSDVTGTRLNHYTWSLALPEEKVSS